MFPLPRHEQLRPMAANPKRTLSTALCTTTTRFTANTTSLSDLLEELRTGEGPKPTAFTTRETKAVCVRLLLLQRSAHSRSRNPRPVQVAATFPRVRHLLIFQTSSLVPLNCMVQFQVKVCFNLSSFCFFMIWFMFLSSCVSISSMLIQHVFMSFASSWNVADATLQCAKRCCALSAWS